MAAAAKTIPKPQLLRFAESCILWCKCTVATFIGTPGGGTIGFHLQVDPLLPPLGSLTDDDLPPWPGGSSTVINDGLPPPSPNKACRADKEMETHGPSSTAWWWLPTRRIYTPTTHGWTDLSHRSGSGAASSRADHRYSTWQYGLLVIQLLQHRTVA